MLKKGAIIGLSLLPSILIAADCNDKTTRAPEDKQEMARTDAGTLNEIDQKIKSLQDDLENNPSDLAIKYELQYFQKHRETLSAKL